MPSRSRLNFKRLQYKGTATSADLDNQGYLYLFLWLFLFVFRVFCISMCLQPYILLVDTGDGWDILEGKGKRNGAGIEV